MNYCGTFRTYSDYNYRRSGLLGWLKRQHFTKALKIAEQYRRDVAVDFGSGDGYLVPALSANYGEVIAVEIREDFRRQIPRTRKVLVTDKLAVRDYVDVVFALETLEHIGDRTSVLREIRDAIRKPGVLIASVPIMTGPTFLVQRLGLWITGSHREPMTWKQIVLSLLGMTKAIPWRGGHAGFNHRELERDIDSVFGRLWRRHRLPFQYVYEIRK